MRPDDRDLDDEIRGHLALSIKERIERGEDPEAARLAALKEFGNVTLTRDSMRARLAPPLARRGRGALARDIRFALRSLLRAKGLAATVVVTLALGIGANAAIFSVVRGVLLRPLVNRDEDRLIYIRQSAPGLGAENMTFSVPEINDFKSRVTTISAFGDFSTVDFTMIGLGGEPRMVKAGVVSGSFFDVMGLRPVLGRLLNAQDDGPKAAGAAVLTYRFWTTSLNSDPTVIGKTIRLGPRTATVVGVLEPSVPYPADTEIIANVVTSPHHLGATMVTSRTHRMTELFGRLAPGRVARSGARRADGGARRASMREHPEAYSAKADVQLSVTTLRDQIAAPARTILLVLLAAAAVVFVIACSNVANLILARSVRREGELAVRAALGAGPGALRRTLLAESLVLCGAGAVLGVVLARPLVAMVARYAARFSVRALEVTVDASVLWVGAGLAMAAAVLLAYVPRLPSPHAPAGLGLATRQRPDHAGHQPPPAGVRDDADRVLVRAARRRGHAPRHARRAADGEHRLRHAAGAGLRHPDVGDRPRRCEGDRLLSGSDAAHQRAARRRGRRGRKLRAVARCRQHRPRLPVHRRGLHARGRRGKSARADAHGRASLLRRARRPAARRPRLHRRRPPRQRARVDRQPERRAAAVPERRRGEPAHVVDRSGLTSASRVPRRIVGVVADVDDENVVPGPALTIYQPVRQMGVAGRLFVRAAGDPYALVPAVTRVIREISADQPVERAATLEDVRAEVLSPERLNAFVFSGFAGIALLIAVVGVAGVLAFSVSARTREFGVRLAVGSAPRHLLARVLSEGVRIAAIGIAAGAAGGYALARVAARFFDDVQLPGALPVLGAAAVLIGAAVVASLMPAARASRVDVLQALRSE